MPDEPPQIIAVAAAQDDDPDRSAASRICVVNLNRDAAAEMVTRVGARPRPLAPTADEVEVRTLHALARQALRDEGGDVRVVADRGPLLHVARRRRGLGRAAVAEA